MVLLHTYFSMSLSTLPNPQNDDLINRLIKNLTNFANEVARTRRHQREDKNFIIDEMCREHKEVLNEFKSVKAVLKEIKQSHVDVSLDVAHMDRTLKCIVHHYNLEEQRDWNLIQNISSENYLKLQEKLKNANLSLFRNVTDWFLKKPTALTNLFFYFMVNFIVGVLIIMTTHGIGDLFKSLQLTKSPFEIIS